MWWWTRKVWSPRFCTISKSAAQLPEVKASPSWYCMNEVVLRLTFSWTQEHWPACRYALPRHAYGPRMPYACSHPACLACQSLALGTGGPPSCYLQDEWGRFVLLPESIINNRLASEWCVNGVEWDCMGHALDAECVDCVLIVRNITCEPAFDTNTQEPCYISQLSWGGHFFSINLPVHAQMIITHSSNFSLSSRD